MKRRADNASLFDESFGSIEQGTSSNLKMLVIVAAFLMVSIAVLLVQPNALSQDMAFNDQGDDLPQTGLEFAPMAEVTRSQTSLLDLEKETEPHRQDVSSQLLEYVRLNENGRNIQGMSWDVLIRFGHSGPVDDPLHTLLTQALNEGQSDAYIDALLNISVARGDIRAPLALQTSTGRLNTQALLQQLIADLK